MKHAKQKITVKTRNLAYVDEKKVVLLVEIRKFLFARNGVRVEVRESTSRRFQVRIIEILRSVY